MNRMRILSALALLLAVATSTANASSHREIPVLRSGGCAASSAAPVARVDVKRADHVVSSAAEAR